MRPKFMVLITVLSLALAAASPSHSENMLNVFFARVSDDVTGTLYHAFIHANKDGAFEATLTTPYGTYPLINYSPHWAPEIGGSFEEDHTSLSLEDFETIIASEWILIWDEDLATQTEAHIGFTPLSDSDFSPMPIITYPENGADYLSGVSRIEWNYGGSDPCVDPVGEVNVVVYDASGGYLEIFGPLSCSVANVTCSIPSSGNQHIVIVQNDINQNATADGIGGPILGDPWILENEYWLLLDSRDQLEFTGSIVEVEGLNFGSLKALYR